jgi:hypothetical protein
MWARPLAAASGINAIISAHARISIMADFISNPVIVSLPTGFDNDKGAGLHAYVVNGAGKIVETAPFDGPAARLGVSAGGLRANRLFIGPAFPAEFPAAKIDVYALVRAGAYQVPVSLGGVKDVIVQRLPGYIIIPPPIHFCEVQGTVTNTVVINGAPQSGPVCMAKVHICTVEWFYRWPIWLRPVVPPPLLGQLKDTVAGLRVAARLPVRRAAARAAGPALKPLPSHIEEQILSATPDSIHEVIAANAKFLHPYFCAWPIFWPWFYRVVEQDVVYTDCNGYYDAWLVSVGAATAENVYVWAEANIGGNWVTVYNPPFPCHTAWNYACGSAIDIALDNAAIPPCNCDSQVIDGSAWFTGIGAYGIASAIQQDVSNIVTLGTPAVSIANVGCTNLYDSNQLNPFGGTLNLYLAFGETLPATHYLWSWTYVLDSSLNPINGATPNRITGAIARSYVWPLSDGSYESGSIPLLDTDADGNIAYIIPNYDVNSYAVPPDSEWQNFNFNSAVLDSTKIDNGYVVRLDLQLMNKNAAGLFEVVSVPVKTFQVSVDTNANAAYDGSVPAPYTANGGGDNYLTLDSAIPGNALSLSVKVRIDNSAVSAAINDAALLPGNISSGPCGFIEFADTTQDVLLSFLASEPFNFATFGYAVTKGNTGTDLLSASGYVFAETAGPFMRAGGTFSDTPTVASLLGNCAQAAFAESLTVYSLATDGTSELWTTGAPYEAGALNAFALSPAPAS